MNNNNIKFQITKLLQLYSRKLLNIKFGVNPKLIKYLSKSLKEGLGLLYHKSYWYEAK